MTTIGETTNLHPEMAEELKIKVILVTPEINGIEEKLAKGIVQREKEIDTIKNEVSKEYQKLEKCISELEGSSYCNVEKIIELSRISENIAVLENRIIYLELLNKPLDKRIKDIIQRISVYRQIIKTNSIKNKQKKDTFTLKQSKTVLERTEKQRQQEEEELQAFAKRMTASLRERKENIDNMSSSSIDHKNMQTTTPHVSFNEKDDSEEDDEEEKQYKATLTIPESPESSDDESASIISTTLPKQLTTADIVKGEIKK